MLAWLETWFRLDFTSPRFPISNVACVSGWISLVPRRPGLASTRCTRTWPPRCPPRRCTGGRWGRSAASPPPLAGRRSPGPGRLRLEMTRVWYLSFCDAILVPWCFVSLFWIIYFLVLCLPPTYVYCTRHWQTLPLQYWLFRCNIEIMFPDNIGDHTPKIGDGVITVTLILITRVQCMLSPNIFSNLETFQESTPTPPSEP